MLTCQHLLACCLRLSLSADKLQVLNCCPFTCRERNDGLYRPITYLIAKMVEELTIFFFLSLLLTVIVFAPCSLGGSYVLFWLVNFVTTATGIGARHHPSFPCHRMHSLQQDILPHATCSLPHHCVASTTL